MRLRILEGSEVGMGNGETPLKLTKMKMTEGGWAVERRVKKLDLIDQI